MREPLNLFQYTAPPCELIGSSVLGNLISCGVHLLHLAILNVM